MAGVSNVDPKSARETTLTALVSAVNALAGNLAAESTFTSMLTELQDILLELDQKVNEEGTIHLDPTDIASLRLVTATVLGMPTDYPDAATHAAIATTNTDIAAGNALLTSILGETGDIDTLAGEMHAQLSAVVTALGSYLSTLAGAVTASTVAVSDSTAHSSLSTVISNLGSILAALASVTVTGPLTDAQLRASAVGVSDSTAQGKLDTLHTDNGSAGSSPPSLATGASGILGYLRGAYDKLTTLAGAVTSSILQANNAQVGGTAVDTNSGNKSGGTQRVVLATDQPALSTPLPISAASLPLPAGAALDATLTSGAQLTKLTNGTQSADTVAGDSGQNMLLTGNSHKQAAITTGGTSTTVIDCANYRWGTIQAVSIGSTISISLETSADNATWLNVPRNSANLVTAAFAVAAITTTGSFIFPVVERYLRVNITAQTGAAPSLFVDLFSSPPPFSAYTVPANQVGTWTVQPGNSQNATPWVVSGLTATRSLNAVTSATTGAAKALGGTMKCQGMQVVVGGTGALSALSVVLEGSLDGGTTFFTLATYSTATSGYIASNNQPTQLIRARAVTVTASSGTPTVSAYVCAA